MKLFLTIFIFVLIGFSCSVHQAIHNNNKIAQIEKDSAIVDFAEASQKFIYFANGHLERTGYQFRILDKDGRKAGELIRASDCKVYSGLYTILPKRIFIAEGNSFSMDVWMDHLGSFTLKLEESTDGGATASVTIKNTKINQWETLVFDFEDYVLGEPTYPKITIFADLLKRPTGKDEVSYFSNVYQFPSDIKKKKTGDKTKGVKIVVLGSSTAAGMGPFESRNSWVNRYRRELQGMNDYNQIINLAVGGYTTYQLLPTGTDVSQNRPQPNSRQNVTMALSLKPDAILINLPSNDVAYGYSIEEQLKNYRVIFKLLQNREIPVWVSTTQGRNFDKGKRQLQMVVRDSTYKMFGRKTLDFWTDLADWSGNISKKYDSGDGVHLNDDGHYLLFKEVLSKKIVQFILDKRSRIVPKAKGYSTPTYRKGYVLIWQDEFNGTELDTSIWTHELGNGCPELCGWGNAEKVWYRSENSQVKGGKLVITAKPDKKQKGYWSSSRLVTSGKKSFRFGRIDIRAKLPETQGLWPALWLLGDSRADKGWPYCGEIDMMEEKGQIPWSVRGTVFYKGSNGRTYYKGGKTELLYGNYSDDFHVYSIDWSKDVIKFFVDDELYTERRYADLDSLSVDDNPFLKPFYMLINLAVGGSYLGYPDDTSVFPQTLEIDYVRHFAKDNYFYSSKVDEQDKMAQVLNIPEVRIKNTHKIVTYNIRLDVASDGENAWPKRKEIFVEQIAEINPDIFGIQEALPHQVKYINNYLANYDYIGVSRDGLKDTEEYSAMFFNREKYEVLNSGTFWLSQTPNQVSKGWDAAYLRICTYGHFKDTKTGNTFWIFNTHLDNEGENARQKGLALIQQKMEWLNPKKEPAILMGDFNTMSNTQLIEALKGSFVDAYSVCEISKKPIGTFNGFGKEKNQAMRIDYIFGYGASVEFKEYRLNRDKSDGHFISDHFPVIVKAVF